MSPPGLDESCEMAAGVNAGQTEGLRSEWLALQAQHEHYEWAALGLKLSALGVCAWGLAAPLAWSLILLLWVQEAVLKTFQARLADRLLRIEQGLRAAMSPIASTSPTSPPAPAVLAMQLHSEWLAQRPRGLGLLKEYAASACRPTVALPYPLLLLLSYCLA